MPSPSVPERTLTVSWEEPYAYALRAQTYSGIEMMRAIRDGELPPPPAAALLGFQVEEVDPGRIVLGIDPGEHHYNASGVVAGGIISALADLATGIAIFTTLPRGDIVLTRELSTRYLRPLTMRAGRIRVIAQMNGRDGSNATSEAVVMDSQGNEYARATASCAVRTVQPAVA